jgi:hypothetical protein
MKLNDILIEIKVDTFSWENENQGKKPGQKVKEPALWFFKFKGADYGLETKSFQGKYAAASKAATKYAKDKGHYDVELMT